MSRDDFFDVAFVVPLQGPAGIYGPSCLSCGKLAVERLNATTGIAGRQVRLVVIDAGRDPESVAAEVEQLVDSGRVQAIAGWHISAVRVAIARRVGGRVVYAFAAMHEGRDDTPGMFMLGERPINQLLPALHWMREQIGVRRWAVVGNDYVFPKVASDTARHALEGSEASIHSATFVPLGTHDFSPILQRLEATGADGVLTLLVGQDAIEFNRQFAQAGLHQVMPRLSTVVEENALLGAGATANQELYAAAAFFDQATEDNDAFSARYYARFGAFAPALNALGESCYEALVFLARLGEVCGSLDIADVAHLQNGHFYESPRGLMRLSGNLMDQDVWMARANGLEFEVQERIAAVS